MSICFLLCSSFTVYRNGYNANIKTRNISLSFNPWLQYLTNKLCSKRNVMIIRIFLRLLRHTLFSTYSYTLIIKVCFHCFSFYQEAKLKQEQEVGFMRFFCDVRQLSHPLEISTNYVLYLHSNIIISLKPVTPFGKSRSFLSCFFFNSLVSQCLL